MKHSLAILFLLSLIPCAMASTGSVKKTEWNYKTVDGVELTAHVFSPAEVTPEADLPCVAFFHGGGWVFGDPSEFFGACERYAGKGFVSISFAYRLSINPDGSYPHPEITLIESVKDARSAIRWIREHAEVLRVDPERIAVGGQSAGGQLALATALIDDINEDTDNLDVSPVPDVLLLFSSNVNTVEAWIDVLMADKRDRIWSISPYHNLRKGMPPTIAFHGEDDCTVLPYIVNLFAERTRQLGNEYELIYLEGRKHYLGAGNERYAGYFDEDILERTDAFLEAHGIKP